MSHITFAQYLQRRQQLVDEYCNHNGCAFAFLPPNGQWNLYNYFLPHRDLTESELKNHRLEVTKQHPSLPQRAGKVFKTIEPLLTNSGPQYVVTPPATPNNALKKSRSTRSFKLTLTTKS